MCKNATTYPNVDFWRENSNIFLALNNVVQISNMRLVEIFSDTVIFLESSLESL